jgi:HlyD family secretion protein
VKEIIGIKKIMWNKKTIVTVVCIVIILITGTMYTLKNNKVKPKEMTIEKVVKKTLTETTTATGNIEAKYRNNIVLNSLQKVLKIAVQEGQNVKKGDLLLELDSSDFENQLEKLKINLEDENLTLNQMVQTGIPAEKSASENSLSQAKYSVENAQRKYEDLKNKYGQSEVLFSSGAIAQSELNEAKKNVEDAETALNSAEDYLTNAQTILNDTNNSSESKIKSQKNQIALIQNDIENYKKKIQDSRISANIDGKVMKIDAKENQFPSTGDQIIIDDVSQYKVVVNLKQYDALKVAQGQQANIKVKGSKDVYSGTVTEIGQLAEAEITSSGSNEEYKVEISVVIDNPKEDVKAGYEADVQFIFKEKEDSISIGFDGIKEDKISGQKYVYVVDSNNKVLKRDVNVGIESDYYVEITDGLEEGESYILNPPESLMEGDLVSQGSSSETSAINK